MGLYPAGRSELIPTRKTQCAQHGTFAQRTKAGSRLRQSVWGTNHMPINSLHDAIAALVPADGRYEDCGRRIIARLDRLWETLDAEALRDELVFWHGLSRGQATDVLELYATARLRTDYDVRPADWTVN